MGSALSRTPDTAQADIDVLYSGVFVERVEIEHLWGIEGSIHVDPKRFRPKLNREGFVGGGLRAELEPFLRRIHPRVLTRAAELLGETLRDTEPGPWTTPRLATLWLAIPRSGEYAEAAAVWDAAFQHKKVLRQLLAENKDRLVSVADLKSSGADAIYLVPLNLSGQSEMVRQAVRVLRDQGKIVIHGVERDSGYLHFASFAFASTEAILMNRFASELPSLEHVSSIADSVLRKEALAEVLSAQVAIKLVPLGADGSALLVAGNEIWINVHTESGRKIVTHLCDNFYGLSSLITACLAHAPGHIQSVANLFQGRDTSDLYIGPVRRQYLRKLLSCPC